MPLEFALVVTERIAQSTPLPLTVDFEGGYARDPEQVAKNVTAVIKAGAVGISFKDQVAGGAGLYDAGVQVDKIKAVRRAVTTHAGTLPMDKEPWSLAAADQSAGSASTLLTQCCKALLRPA